MEDALRFLGAALSGSKHPAEGCISASILYPHEHVGCIGETQMRSDAQSNSGFLGGLMSPHHSAEGIQVGNADGAMPGGGGFVNQLIRMRSPSEEGEIGGDV